MFVRMGIVAVVVVASALAFSSGALAGADDALGPLELARLGRGELVQRTATEQRGALRLMGGSSWQVIDAAPDVVWTALLDTAHYPRFLPQLADARVVHDGGHTRTVFMQHAGVLGPSYYLALKVDEAQRNISFRLDDRRPHDIRAAWGFYAVRPYAGDRTLLAYGVKADIGDGVVSAVLRSSTHEWMMKVPWMVKRFIEGSGRYLYAKQARAAKERALAAAAR
jgi:ribosome-associated toxin RatA of RatAB toxin-antitoxin module